MHLLAICSLLVVSTSLGDAFLLLHDVPRKVTKILTVDNGGTYGDWGPPQFCAAGSYATGYNMKLEEYQHGGDDTALNGIMLQCENIEGGVFGGQISSKVGIWGSYHGLTQCDNQQGVHFLTGFALQVEPYQQGGDDTEANYIKFKCRDMDATVQNYELAHPPGVGLFGSYGSWSEQCEAGSAICGLSTRVEDSVGGGDDTALNDVKMYCCSD